MDPASGASLEPQPLAERPPCNVCGSCERVLLHAPKRAGVPVCETFSASKGVLAAQRIVRCARCGLVYVCPRPPSDQILDAYARSADAPYVSQADARTRTFRRAMRLVRRHAPVPGKILDIGAAAGFFCAAARECGWDATGVEPSRWLAEWGAARLGVAIRAGTVREQAFADGQFDAVTMWDSIEHMPDPGDTLGECRRILAPGGLLIINTPNIGSLLARAAGPKWWFLLSHHLYYFTPRTLSLLLDRSGFRVMEIRRHWQTLELGHLAAMAGIYSRGLSSAAGRLLGLIRAGGLRVPYYAAQMNVVARARPAP